MDKTQWGTIMQSLKNMQYQQWHTQPTLTHLFHPAKQTTVTVTIHDWGERLPTWFIHGTVKQFIGLRLHNDVLPLPCTVLPWPAGWVFKHCHHTASLSPLTTVTPCQFNLPPVFAGYTGMVKTVVLRVTGRQLLLFHRVEVRVSAVGAVPTAAGCAEEVVWRRSWGTARDRHGAWKVHLNAAASQGSHRVIQSVVVVDTAIVVEPAWVLPVALSPSAFVGRQRVVAVAVEQGGLPTSLGDLLIDDVVQLLAVVDANVEVANDLNVVVELHVAMA